MNSNLREEQNKIVNGGLISSVIAIIGILLGILIIIDQKEKINNKEGFLTNEESQTIALIVKSIFLIVTLYNLYLNNKSYDLAKENNQNTNALQLQIYASYLAIIAAIIGLYVVITNYPDSSFQASEIENNI